MSTPGVTVVEAGAQKVSRRVTVNAPAAELFEMVADPHRHPELDGSGSVRPLPVLGPDRLSQDAKFTVKMKQFGFPYKITSRVTAFEDGRLVEWRHPAGHTWRWEFEPAGPTTTVVTETWDYSTSKAPGVMKIAGQVRANVSGITATLTQLAARYS